MHWPRLIGRVRDEHRSVRYIDFYTQHVGVALEAHPAAGIAILSHGDLQLLVNVPGGPGGAGVAMPDGRLPEPRGWNRITIQVDDLDATVATLRKSGAHFRNDIVTGLGGKQILLEDPAGNPIELFEPRRE